MKKTKNEEYYGVGARTVVVMCVACNRHLLCWRLPLLLEGREQRLDFHAYSSRWSGVLLVFLSCDISWVSGYADRLHWIYCLYCKYAGGREWPQCGWRTYVISYRVICFAVANKTACRHRVRAIFRGAATRMSNARTNAVQLVAIGSKFWILNSVRTIINTTLTNAKQRAGARSRKQNETGCRGSTAAGVILALAYIYGLNVSSHENSSI